MAFVEDLLGNEPNRWILAPEFIHLYQWPLFIVTPQISMLELSLMQQEKARASPPFSGSRTQRRYSEGFEVKHWLESRSQWQPVCASVSSPVQVGVALPKGDLERILHPNECHWGPCRVWHVFTKHVTCFPSISCSVCGPIR